MCHLVFPSVPIRSTKTVSILIFYHRESLCKIWFVEMKSRNIFKKINSTDKKNTCMYIKWSDKKNIINLLQRIYFFCTKITVKKKQQQQQNNRILLYCKGNMNPNHFCYKFSQQAEKLLTCWSLNGVILSYETHLFSRFPFLTSEILS